MFRAIRIEKTWRNGCYNAFISVALALGCSSQDTSDSKMTTDVGPSGIGGGGTGGSAQVIADSSGGVQSQSTDGSTYGDGSSRVAQADAEANAQQPVIEASVGEAGFDINDASVESLGDANGGAESSTVADSGTVGDASDDADASQDASTYRCPATVPKAGSTDGTITVDGTNRTYVLYIPSSYTGNTPVPLVFDWHGLMLNGSIEQLMFSSYVAKADEEGFIMVFPNGIDGAWNIGPCCTVSRDVDDLSFARELVKKLTSELCIDSKRVYSVGFSMGGGMSHFLACNAADIFAAVAPAAFDLLLEEEEPCRPSRPISEISFRGTADFIVPYDGGASRPPNGLDVTIHFLGAEATFQKWAELNGCTGTPIDGVAGIGCRTYTECDEGVEVTLCTNEGGDHLPGDANIAWPMIKKHSLP